MGISRAIAVRWAVLAGEFIICSRVSAQSPEPFLIEGPGTRPATEIRQLVHDHGSVALRNLKIEGELVLEDEAVEQFSCEDVEFLSDFRVFQLYNVKAHFTLKRAVFRGAVDFYLSTVEDLEFNHCQFGGIANLHSLKTARLWLNGSSFDRDVILVAAQIGNLNLADTHFEKTVDFSGATIQQANTIRVRSNQPIIISWAQFGEADLSEFLSWAIAPDDEEERQSRLWQVETHLLFWKRNFAALGQARDTARTNYEIIKLRRQYFMTPYQVEWWATLLLGVPNGYGTSPFRPLWIALAVIAIFAFYYWRKDPFILNGEAAKNPKQPLLWFALLYSVDTFLPVIEVTGVKDWGWRISQRYRWIELAERLLGLAVGALAAYSIGSYAI